MRGLFIGCIMVASSDFLVFVRGFIDVHFIGTIKNKGFHIERLSMLSSLTQHNNIVNCQSIYRIKSAHKIACQRFNNSTYFLLLHSYSGNHLFQI
jgi:hypothetical protein